MPEGNRRKVSVDDVMISALPDFPDGDLDDIAHTPADHSKRVRIAAMKELRRRSQGDDIDSGTAWKIIQAEKPGYAARASERSTRRDELRKEAGELARRIREHWSTAVTSRDWTVAVEAYEAVLRDRVRESAVLVELGERKKVIPDNVTTARAEGELRNLREKKIAEADALEARQREWATAENKRDEGNRHPRRRPAYMDDVVRRPPEPPHP